MELTANMLAMDVEVAGEAVALHVRQGRNNFCGKPEGGVLRVGRGAWTKGEYELFVGTTEAGQTKPFKLRVVEVKK
jgi:hypothetical protein